MPGVALGAGLVAEDSERKDSGVDGPVVGNDRLDQRPVGVQIVGVELAGMYGHGTSLADHRGLLAEPVCSPRGQHHRRAGCQTQRQLGPNFAAATENDERPRTRVIHGCDYGLR
jgi:hypothetical protein